MDFFLNSNFPANEFNIITIIEVLEHIKEDSKVIKKIHGILKTNGIIIVSVPYVHDVNDDFSTPSLTIKDKNGQYVKIGLPGELHYRNGYNVKSLTSLLESNGFTIEDISYTRELRIIPDSMILFPVTYLVTILFNKLSNNYSKLTVLAKKT